MQNLASSQAPSAWIVASKDKGRKSIKNNKVYLNDGEEFEIELYNPLQECVLSDIKLNGHSISENGLILKPGQRFYLDCFIDDKKKFVFNTYEIEDSSESIKATEKNGLLEVFFYKESVVTLKNWKSKFQQVIIEKWYPVYYPSYPYYPNPWNPYGNVYCGTGNITLNTGCSTNTATYTTGTLNCSYTSPTSNNLFTSNIKNIETGRIEKGSESDQKFTEVDMDFESNYISSIILQILPESRKPIETKDIKNKDTDVVDLIKKLAELHKSGILTDSEFQSKKSELLSKL